MLFYNECIGTLVMEGLEMEKKCYSCGCEEFQIGTIATHTENEVMIFTQALAEVQVCVKCGAILTITGEHPHYKRVKEQY
ncbi:hypothetical protein BAMA111019_01520 [Bacillus manliponensis]